MAGTLPYANHPDVVGARSLVTAALVLYGVLVLLLLLVGVFLPFALIWAVLFLIMLLIAYLVIQEPLKRGDVARAGTPALVLGILSILLLNIISGILLLVAYARIGRADAIRLGALGGVPAGGLSPSVPLAPTGSRVPADEVRYCSSCGAPLTPSDRYCSNCRTPVPP
ncbi:MAG: zinc-ribbon domain-containing protein [Thermoplasmata archaeon]